ncbi:DcaP family trimeric outer membrane transporter, partial [Acinetobacter sp. Res13-Abat-PEC09-P3-02]
MKKFITLSSTCIIFSITTNVNAATDEEIEVLSKRVYELEQLVNKLNSNSDSPIHLNKSMITIDKNTSKDQPKFTEINQSSKERNLIVGNDILMKVYGALRLDASYDFKGTTNSVVNRTGLVPLDKDNPTQGALNVSVATSKIGLDISKPTDYGILMGKFEADFWGDSTSNADGKLRITHAYGSLGKWLIGQTTSPFVNTDTSPSIIDYTGPMGGGTQRNVQLRFTQPIKNDQKFLVALEGGNVDNFSGKTQITGGSKLPAITLRYDKNFPNDKGLIQLHGMLHENRVSTNQNNYKEQIGWGAGVGARYKLTNNNEILANYYHVVGDTRYLAYSNQNNASYFSTENLDSNGVIVSYDIEPSQYHTLQVGYQRLWAPSLKSTFSIAGIQFKDNTLYAKKNPLYNETLYNTVANLIFTPINNLNLGIEYTYGQRKNFIDDKGT